MKILALRDHIKTGEDLSEWLSICVSRALEKRADSSLGEVSAVCELFGADPFQSANEERFIAFIAREEVDGASETLIE